MNAKPLILSEMVFLFIAGLVMAHQNGEEWTGIVLSRVWKQGLAVAILLAILVTLADLGFGGFAAAIGGLIIAGYLATAGSALGYSILATEKNIFA